MYISANSFGNKSTTINRLKSLYSELIVICNLTNFLASEKIVA